VKVLSFGEIIWDVYPDKSCIGGAPLNFAAHVAKNGAESYLVSCIGNDRLGKEAMQRIAKFGVKDDFVSTCDRQTGICKVTLDANAVPTYTIVDDVAYDYIGFENKLLQTRFDLFAFGTLALRGKNNREVVKKILQSSVCDKVYCDLNLRAPFFDKEVVEFCLQHCDIVKVSDNEVDFVCDEVLGVEYTNACNFAKHLSQRYTNLDVVLFTCGDKGAYAYLSQCGELYFQPAKQVEVVSTVGAGDCFGAVFVPEYMTGGDVHTCLKKATEKSAYVVSKQDAVPD